MRYSQDGTIFEGKAPETPLLNSLYDSSFIAYLIQQRFVYGLPVERIVRYLHEMNIDISKQLVYGLLTKSADMLDKLAPVLKQSKCFHDDA